MCPLISSGRTGSRRLTLGMRLDRFVAIVTYSFDLVSIYSFNLPDRCTLQEQFRLT
jgi:hypothetical protein